MKLSAESREQWLEQRRGVLTATEIAEIASSPTSAERIRREKATGERSFRGNRYTDWGHEREPFIADYMRSHIESDLEYNDCLWVSDEDPQVGATPDMILLSPGGVHAVGEIKTVIRHRDWGAGDIPQRYYDQIQIQLYVTGAKTCFFAWEPYIDVEGMFYPDGPVESRVIERDEQRISELLKIKEAYFSGEDASIPDIEPLVCELAEWDEQIERLEAQRDECKKRLQAVLGSDPQSWHFNGVGTVRITKPGVRRTFDKKAFEKDYPELAGEYMRESEIKPAFRFTRVKEGQ